MVYVCLVLLIWIILSGNRCIYSFLGTKLVLSLDSPWILDFSAYARTS